MGSESSVTSDDTGRGGSAPVAVSESPRPYLWRPEPILAVPYIGGIIRRETVRAALDAKVPIRSYALDPDDPGHYAQVLTRLWRRGGTFVVMEHDIVPAPGQVRALIECEHQWCAHTYNIKGYRYGPLLGLAKFSIDLVRAYPDLAHSALFYNRGKREWVNWRSCSERLASELGGRGVECHWHHPDPVHLHDYDTPGGTQ